MKISMHSMSVDVLSNILGNLSWLLEKGEAHATAKKIDPSVLLASRLAPDMFPLTRQVQVACDIAKNSVSRLAGLEPPRFEDNETSFEQLRARIARTVAFMKGLPAKDFENSETRDIRVPAGPDRTLEFKGLPFLQTWAIPHVFFHVTTAYNILRHNGVELGKADYIGGGKQL
ncbi:MAG: DUF1993 domain-containing protein [Proteobacteria bacterium]|nr:DUF1993 domain-containing protein [Pseudomonadota bacterium]